MKPDVLRLLFPGTKSGRLGFVDMLLPIERELEPALLLFRSFARSPGDTTSTPVAMPTVRPCRTRGSSKLISHRLPPAIGGSPHVAQLSGNAAAQARHAAILERLP